MAVRKYEPTTPGRRGASVSSFDELTRSTPEKFLVAKGRNKAGRNTHGRVTARHQGGGNKRRYRVIDFRRDKDGVPAKVAHIEYDPNRTAGSPCCTTSTARSATSLRRKDWRWATTWSPARARTFARGTPWPFGTSPSGRRCTPWSSSPVRAPAWLARRGRASS